jgi:hypothetical protein
MTVSMYYDLLPKKDMEPLQGLVDIFIAQGVIPKEAVAMHLSWQTSLWNEIGSQARMKEQELDDISHWDDLA